MKARCKTCEYFCLNMLSNTYERDLPPFCGLHGRTRIDPDGEQRNLDHNGGCGYHKKEPVQLTLFDNEDFLEL